jgi:hypothetical protein
VRRIRAILASIARITGMLGALGAVAWWVMVLMPGRSFRGPLPPPTAQEVSLSAELRRDVVKLAGEIGERNVMEPKPLWAAESWLHSELERAGYVCQRQAYDVTDRDRPVACANLEVEIRGKSRPAEIVVVGAHYDSAIFAPGADDNATGAAAVLALARSLSHAAPERTLRFVEFVNEEPPSFQRASMGSLVYAKRCKERGENVVAMLSLESLGYFSDDKGSQQYPSLFRYLYPSTGNFIAFVGDVRSRGLVHRALGTFRATTPFPSEGTATWGAIPGVGWSDHWAFWEQGYPALMITDTAPFRYRQYHTSQDTPDRVDFDRLARVVKGIERVVVDLLRPG